MLDVLGNFTDWHQERRPVTSDMIRAPRTIFDQLVDSFVPHRTPAAETDDTQAMPPIEVLFARSEEASAFLKALAHEGRLMILCSLVHGEKSVTELENLLNSRQAAVSQQLARLRLEGIVSARRDGKTIYYSLRDPKVQEMIALLYKMFCLPA